MARQRLLVVRKGMFLAKFVVNVKDWFTEATKKDDMLKEVGILYVTLLALDVSFLDVDC